MLLTIRKKTSQLIKDLETVQNSTFTVPSSFKVKNNWFFESFLNPLLYISLDISSILTDDIDQFVVKRVILNIANNDDFSKYFDENYKGKKEEFIPLIYSVFPTTIKELGLTREDFVFWLNDPNYYQGYFSEDNIKELHAYLMTVHRGRPRADGEIVSYS